MPAKTKESEKTFTDNEVHAALSSAKAAAQLLRTTDDDGTCNFDSLCILFKTQLAKQVKVLAPQLGIHVHDRTWLGDRMLFMDFGEGQANRRTTMMEAAAKVLEGCGWVVHRYYQMD
jgi:hypothetical protein